MAMRGYVVSKGGTFGVVQHNYITEDGHAAIVIRWGPLGWLTPVLECDCKQLRSRYEDEALAEAREWVHSMESQP